MADENTNDPEAELTSQDHLRNYGYAVGGALAGAAAAFYAVSYLLKTYGLYAPVLPGVAVGAISAAVTWGKSILRGLICALIALPAHLYTEYKISADKNGEPYTDFLKFVSEMPGLTYAFIGVGVVCAFWIGKSGWRQPGEHVTRRGRL